MMRRLLWALLRRLHHWDFAWQLPLLARLPLALAYALGSVRGRLNAAAGRDWRSLALGWRHIRQRTLMAYAALPVPSDAAQRAIWCQQRFRVEAREELEAWLVAHQRLAQLQCHFEPAVQAVLAQPRSRGLLMLTPHFDSFFLGTGFLARAAGRVNLMSSEITEDPRVDPAVSVHFRRKYRGLEAYLHGGQVRDMEQGIRAFYRMLERREILVVLGDTPKLANGVGVVVDFLGGPRELAGGALAMAERTDSDVGAFVCRCLGPGRYRMDVCLPDPGSDIAAQVQQAYTFLGAQILATPGAWWGADLLPDMPLVDVGSVRAGFDQSPRA